MSDNQGQKIQGSSIAASILSVFAAACFLPMLFDFLGYLPGGGLEVPGSPTYVFSILGIFLLLLSSLIQTKFCIERGISLKQVRRFIVYLKFGSLLGLVFLLLINVTIVLAPADEDTPREGIAFLLAAFVILTAMWRYLNWKMERHAIEHRDKGESAVVH